MKSDEKDMTLDPGPHRKKTIGVLGGAGPSGFGFGDPACPVWVWLRVRPHDPDLSGPGPRRNMGGFWDWVCWGLRVPVFAACQIDMKNMDFRYFQDPRALEKYDF